MRIPEEVRAARLVAVREAMREVREGTVLGLGSGSTISLLIEELASRQLSLLVIPSSNQTMLQSVRHGLKLTSLDQHPEPNLTMDSFDQMNKDGDAIKGGGGALLREKILCHASRKVVFVGDEKKMSHRLDRPVPLEVLPFARSYVSARLVELGGKPRVRVAEREAGPVFTDNGNILIDVDFGEIAEPAELEAQLRKIPGLLENGLFIRVPDRVYVGHLDGGVSILDVRRRVDDSSAQGPSYHRGRQQLL